MSSIDWKKFQLHKLFQTGWQAYLDDIEGVPLDMGDSYPFGVEGELCSMDRDRSLKLVDEYQPHINARVCKDQLLDHLIRRGRTVKLYRDHRLSIESEAFVFEGVSQNKGNAEAIQKLPPALQMGLKVFHLMEEMMDFKEPSLMRRLVDTLDRPLKALSVLSYPMNSESVGIFDSVNTFLRKACYCYFDRKDMPMFFQSVALLFRLALARGSSADVMFTISMLCKVDPSISLPDLQLDELIDEIRTLFLSKFAGSSKPELFTFGKSDTGRLGHGSSNITAQIPRSIESLREHSIECVSSFSTHTLACSRLGTVLGWGNGQHGRLGTLSTTHQFSPVILPDLSGVKIVNLAVGLSHSVLLSSTGHLFTFGSGLNGRLGHGDLRERLSPVRITSFQVSMDGPVKLACGSSFTFVCTEGALYSWGKNSAGQCGQGTFGECLVPKAVDFFSDVETVVDVCGGWDHALACTESGKVFSWGCGYEGNRPVLGNGSSSRQATPQLIVKLEEFKIVKVGAGYDHSMAVTDKGELFVWGSNSGGQLGTGDGKDHTYPVLVSALKSIEVSTVDGGMDHSLAVTKDGQLYSWGSGTEFALGHGSSSLCPIPRLVQFFEKKYVKSIACGDKCSTVLTYFPESNSEEGPSLQMEPVDIIKDEQFSAKSSGLSVFIWIANALVLLERFSQDELLFKSKKEKFKPFSVFISDDTFQCISNLFETDVNAIGIANNFENLNGLKDLCLLRVLRVNLFYLEHFNVSLDCTPFKTIGKRLRRWLCSREGEKLPKSLIEANECYIMGLERFFFGEIERMQLFNDLFQSEPGSFQEFDERMKDRVFSKICCLSFFDFLKASPSSLDMILERICTGYCDEKKQKVLFTLIDQFLGRDKGEVALYSITRRVLDWSLRELHSDSIFLQSNLDVASCLIQSILTCEELSELIALLEKILRKIPREKGIKDVIYPLLVSLLSCFNHQTVINNGQLFQYLSLWMDTLPEHLIDSVLRVMGRDVLKELIYNKGNDISAFLSFFKRPLEIDNDFDLLMLYISIISQSHSETLDISVISLFSDISLDVLSFEQYQLASQVVCSYLVKKWDLLGTLQSDIWEAILNQIASSVSALTRKPEEGLAGNIWKSCKSSPRQHYAIDEVYHGSNSLYLSFGMKITEKMPPSSDRYFGLSGHFVLAISMHSSVKPFVSFFLKGQSIQVIVSSDQHITMFHPPRSFKTGEWSHIFFKIKGGEMTLSIDGEVFTKGLGKSFKFPQSQLFINAGICDAFKSDLDFTDPFDGFISDLRCSYSPFQVPSFVIGNRCTLGYPATVHLLSSLKTAAMLGRSIPSCYSSIVSMDTWVELRLLAAELIECSAEAVADMAQCLLHIVYADVEKKGHFLSWEAKCSLEKCIAKKVSQNIDFVQQTPRILVTVYALTESIPNKLVLSLLLSAIQHEFEKYPDELLMPKIMAASCLIQLIAQGVAISNELVLQLITLCAKKQGIHPNLSEISQRVNSALQLMYNGTPFHVEMVSEPTDPFGIPKCYRCNFQCANESQFVYHFMRDHEDDTGRADCPFCTAKDVLLLLHFQMRHMNSLMNFNGEFFDPFDEISEENEEMSEQVQQMIAMGFSADISKLALEEAQNDLMAATNWILNHQDTVEVLLESRRAADDERRRQQEEKREEFILARQSEYMRQRDRSWQNSYAGLLLGVQGEHWDTRRGIEEDFEDSVEMTDFSALAVEFIAGSARYAVLHSDEEQIMQCFDQLKAETVYMFFVNGMFWNHSLFKRYYDRHSSNGLGKCIANGIRNVVDTLMTDTSRDEFPFSLQNAQQRFQKDEVLPELLEMLLCIVSMDSNEFGVEFNADQMWNTLWNHPNAYIKQIVLENASQFNSNSIPLLFELPSSPRRFKSALLFSHHLNSKPSEQDAEKYLMHLPTEPFTIRNTSEGFSIFNLVPNFFKASKSKRTLKITLSLDSVEGLIGFGLVSRDLHDCKWIGSDENGLSYGILSDGCIWYQNQIAVPFTQISVKKGHKVILYIDLYRKCMQLAVEGHPRVLIVPSVQWEEFAPAICLEKENQQITLKPTDFSFEETTDQSIWEFDEYLGILESLSTLNHPKLIEEAELIYSKYLNDHLKRFQVNGKPQLLDISTSVSFDGIGIGSIIQTNSVQGTICGAVDGNLYYTVLNDSSSDAIEFNPVGSTTIEAKKVEFSEISEVDVHCNIEGITHTLSRLQQSADQHQIPLFALELKDVKAVDDSDDIVKQFSLLLALNRVVLRLIEFFSLDYLISITSSNWARFLFKETIWADISLLKSFPSDKTRIEIQLDSSGLLVPQLEKAMCLLSPQQIWWLALHPEDITLKLDEKVISFDAFITKFDHATEPKTKFLGILFACSVSLGMPWTLSSMKKENTSFMEGFHSIFPEKRISKVLKSFLYQSTN